MLISDGDIFEAARPRTVWFDVHGLMRSWRRRAESLSRPRRRAKYVAAVAAALIGCSMTAHAVVEPVQLTLNWPAEKTAAATKHSLLQSLKRLRHLKADWNGRGAAAPVERSISIAEWILPQLPDVVADAKADLDGDGNVLIRIKNGEKIAYLTVEPKVMHLLYIEPGQPNIYIDDAVVTGKMIPVDITKVLGERLNS